MSRAGRSMSEGPTCREAAFDYRSRGWSVVPVEGRGKRPLVKWEAFQERRPEPEEIEGWFARWPEANVAIVTGRVSGLVVLDVDPRHGGDDSLAVLERRHGALPDTLEALSGGGGRHLYFAHPGGLLGNRVGIAPGLDLRADGGLVVAPPSVHPSGRPYLWEVGHDPEAAPLTPAPPWLLLLFRGAGGGRGHSPAHWRRLSRDGVAQGERNSSIASFAGHLLWHGVDPAVVLELLLAWNRLRCRPPLDDHEVARTVESIRQTRLRQGN